MKDQTTNSCNYRAVIAAVAHRAFEFRRQKYKHLNKHGYLRMSLYSKFSNYYELIFPFKTQTYSFLSSYLTGDNSRILDIGCGTGHYIGRFAEQGHFSTGVDIDKSMIEYATNSYPQAAFLNLDMLNIHSVNESFNLIYSIGNVVSYLSQNQSLKFLNSVYNALAQGGVWIFQTVNWDNILKNQEYVFPVIYRQNRDIKFSRRYNKISEHKINFQTALEYDNQKVFEDSHTLYPVKENDNKIFHRNIGFKFLAHYGDFNRNPYDLKSSPASIFVYQK
ncbi:MAG: class I SAM-dependent methyltransferase [Candidatus Latescibacteria bacterium]|nr:class I SAM-dependent methyltransferase [Candidatus Latescibacterota bacterium]